MFLFICMFIHSTGWKNWVIMIYSELRDIRLVCCPLVAIAHITNLVAVSNFYENLSIRSNYYQSSEFSYVHLSPTNVEHFLSFSQSHVRINFSFENQFSRLSIVHCRKSERHFSFSNGFNSGNGIIYECQMHYYYYESKNWSTRFSQPSNLSVITTSVLEAFW